MDERELLGDVDDDAGLVLELVAHEAERRLFVGVLAMEGSISGEHGIGFAKAKHLGLELNAETIALMKRVKRAFDPNGILNPAVALGLRTYSLSYLIGPLVGGILAAKLYEWMGKEA